MKTVYNVCLMQFFLRYICEKRKESKKMGFLGFYFGRYTGLIQHECLKKEKDSYTEKEWNDKQKSKKMR